MAEMIGMGMEMEMEMETFQRVMGAFPCLHPTPSKFSAAAATAAAATPDPDGVDRISTLPDDILRDVVSRLPVRDAARTAALATRWRGLWRAAPLVLRDADLLVSSSDERQRPDAAVGRILADHPGPFHKVSLTHCSSFASRERELGEWARLLANKGVQDLILFDNPPLPTSSVLRFPADILRCASLNRLFLGVCTFPDTTGAPRGPDVFPHLKEFSMLTANMSEHDLEHMLACSPKLETLALIISKMPKHIRLRSQSLKCMLLWSGLADELAVVDAPCLGRLILWGTAGAGAGGRMTLKIDRAPELCVLGQLHPRLHQLQIGKTIINAQTKASPSCSVPSIKILSLQLNFAIFKDVSMVTSFLRCFPNIETLHIQSSRAGEATAGWHNTKFWQEVHPIKCLKSHVKKIVIHEFQGDQSEFGFIKFIAKRVRKLQVLVLKLTKEKYDSADEVDEVYCQLGALTKGSWAGEQCQVLLVGPKLDYSWSFTKASDLSVKDPFW